MLKPFSQSCINNRDFILERLRGLFDEESNNEGDVNNGVKRKVLEVGSGTGQHGVYFANHLPVQWQMSDFEENHQGINTWIEATGADNCLAPILLNVSDEVWAPQRYNALFTANSLHIMSWDNVVQFFQKAHTVLEPNGLVIVYGPFNYNGDYTSDSNERFDQFLQASGPEKGIRDAEKINKLALENHLLVVADHEMPANNRLLVWRFERAG
jgi:cyclopropane fatty-acyl-phospholipid synthase-like methyltransferase